MPPTADVLPDMKFFDFNDLIVDNLTDDIVVDIKGGLAAIESQDFSLLPGAELQGIQELLNTIRYFMPMILVEKPMIDIVRVTRNPRVERGFPERIHKLSRLKYPPADKTEMGRANLRNRSVLYASFFGLASVVESRVAAGDLVTRSTWRMITYVDTIKTSVIFQDDMILQRLPYFQEFQTSYQAMLARRAPLEAELTRSVNNFVARQFTKKVPAGKRVNYLVSAFIGDMLLNQNKLDALVYPSVQLDLLDACVAMRTDLFDYMFYPVSCTEGLVNSVPDDKGNHWYTTKTAFATEFDVDGDTIHWDPAKSSSEEDLLAFQKQRADERAQMLSQRTRRNVRLAL
jgi:hypothetical protein